jgi:hypothetical protein
MSTQTQVTCSCGQRVVVTDVVQQGRVLRLFSPSLIYLKFECSHCKRVSERFMPEAEWDPGALRATPHEATRDERRRFEEMGEITLDEILNFHSVLHARPLPDLRNDAER